MAGLRSLPVLGLWLELSDTTRLNHDCQVVAYGKEDHLQEVVAFERLQPQ